MRILGLLVVGSLAIGVTREVTSRAARADDVATVASETDWKHLSKVDWRPTLAAAQQEAREKKKLVFWYHVVGKIDEEGT